MKENNGFSDFTAAAGEKFELFCLSVAISLCFYDFEFIFTRIECDFFFTLLNFNVIFFHIAQSQCAKNEIFAH